MAVGFGIVGCGAIAGFHADGIAATEGAYLAGVTDVNPVAAARFAMARGTQAFDSLEAMCESQNVDCVCICTPSGLHAPQALTAIEHGRHVLIEKPLALNTADCDRIIEAARRKGAIVGTVSQLRFADTTQRLKREIANGTLGRLLTGDVIMRFRREKEYYQSSAWRGTWKMDGGGALMNQGIHGIDLLLYLMGDVKSVYGFVRTLAHNIETEDTAVAALEFSNGALGLIEGTTSIYPGYPREISISGTEGTIAVAEHVYTRWDIKNADRPTDIMLGGEQLSAASIPTNIDSEGHTLHIRDMVRAIETGSKPFVSAESARKTVRLITAVYESSVSGKRVDIDN